MRAAWFVFGAYMLALAVASVGARGSRPSARVQAFWDRVADCETGGNWRMRGQTYSGGPGFYNGTWSTWAAELKLRYRNAADAPRLVQVRVADYGYRVHGGYWGTIANGCAGTYP